MLALGTEPVSATSLGAAGQIRVEAPNREHVLETIGAQLARPSFVVETPHMTGVLIQSAHVHFVEVRDLRSVSVTSQVAADGSARIPIMAEIMAER